MRFVSMILVFGAMIGSATTMEVHADEPQQITLTDTVDVSFGKAWNAVREAMQEFGCPEPQTEKVIEPAEELGFYKGIYVSDFCIMFTGEDSTKIKMEEFGKIPPIRGGIWITGRVQFKLNVKEVGVRKTVIRLRAELSGFEEFITNRVFFWTSNGVLERRMRDDILNRINSN